MYILYIYIYTQYTYVYTYGKNLGSRPITKNIKIPRPPQRGRPLLVMKVLCNLRKAKAKQISPCLMHDTTTINKFSEFSPHSRTKRR